MILKFTSGNRRSASLSLPLALISLMVLSSLAGAMVVQTAYSSNGMQAVDKNTANGVSILGTNNSSSLDFSEMNQSQALQVAQAAAGPSALSGPSVWLGNFNGSYLQPIYIPVYSNSMGLFNGLSQTFSYDPNVLSFNGTLNDVSSQNVSFSYSLPSSGIVQVRAVGTFDAYYNNTVLYYLVFNSLTHNQVVTSVLLDESIINGVHYYSSYLSKVKLVRGWTNLGPSNISAPWEIENGGAGTVPAVGYSPYNMSVLYVASGRGGPWQGNLYQGADVNGFGGMFKSVDGGRTWSNIDLGLNSTEVNAIEVNPSNPNELVIATGGLNTIVGGGIYKSINGGKSWQETYNMGGNNFVLNNNVLYAASYHAILYSTDFGSTWHVLASFVPIVTTLSISNNGSLFYVGVYYPTPDVQILFSSNRGSTFSEVANFPGYYTVSQIAIDPSNNSNLIALVHHGYTNYTSLFRSQNYGMNWTGINDTAVGINLKQIASLSSGTFREAPQAISYDPLNGSIVYVIGPGYIYRSTDGGYKFTMLNSYWGSPNGGQDNRMISIDPLNDSIIFVGSDQGLIVTYNGGISWEGLNNRSSNMLYDVAVDGQYIFTTAQDWSPLYSNNYGKTWYQARGSEEGFVEVDPYNTSIVLQVPPWNNVLNVSNNGGKTFFPSLVNETELFVQARDSPDAVAFGPNMIYIYGKDGIFYSNNSGHSFNLISGSPRGNPLSGGGTLTVSYSNPNVLYASNWNGLYVSYNYGFNWTKVNTLLSVGTGQVGSIAIDPHNSSIIFFDIYRGDTVDTVYESLNGGRTYAYANISSQEIFVAPPYLNYYDYKGSLYLVYVTGEGVYISTNQGKTWENVNYNVITPVVSSFILSSNGSAYISTYGTGVWYDPSLLNFSFYFNRPLLTGYIPTGGYIILNGFKINKTGYFVTYINSGYNNIYVSSIGGNVTINGVPGNVYFQNFSSRMQYNATFSETGLPVGTLWSVTLNGTTKTSTASTITFSVPNGAYSFTVGAISGYTTSPSSGTVTVSGANVNQAITFTPITTTIQKYNVIFIESGLPSGASWSVTLNGTTESSNSSTITFIVQSGTYPYTITAQDAAPQSGTITVSGSNATESVTFTSTTPPSTKPPSGISSIELYGIIGAIIVIVAVLAAVVLFRHKK